MLSFLYLSLLILIQAFAREQQLCGELESDLSEEGSLTGEDDDGTGRPAGGSSPLPLPDDQVRDGQWAEFAHRIQGSPTPSSASDDSCTTADTFLLEDVSGLAFLFPCRKYWQEGGISQKG